MKRNYRLTTLLVGLFLLARPGWGQSDEQPLWRAVPGPAARGTAAAPGQWFRLDAARLTARLAQAPPETRPTEAVPLELPYPDGTLHRFLVTQVPVMAPALAARYPQIRTYAARALDEPATTARLEWTSQGLHAQILTATGTVQVQADAANPALYQSQPQERPEFTCLALPVPGQAQRPQGGTPPAAPAPYGSQIRVLRLALAATGEYVQKLGGNSVQGTVESMNRLVNSLNAIYERDLALRLVLVAGTDKLIYLDPATDPYDNASPSDLMETNRTQVTTVLGSDAYDIGHVLGYRSNGYSGIAYVGVTCRASHKGGGSSTGSSARSMADVLVHEIGHQLGSGHTFNGDKGNCGNGNRGTELAFEPGAGNTIMSYDSRCAPDNVGGGIDYFHAGSISAILSRISQTCGTVVPTSNRPPSVSVPPSTYTIPKGTPFSLAGRGSDLDGDTLTYSWEQLDRGDPTGLANAATDPTGPPLFRSFAPVATPVRTFPALSAILSNTASVGEILPLVARQLNFRLTVRDNHHRGGGVAAANVAVAVAEAGPFRITAPNEAFTAAPGSLYTLTWDVLGTDQAPVSCANVQVLFSEDGGLTFPTVLVASTPNDGSASVRLPNLLTTKGRLKVQAVGNIFFAINNANLTLSGPLTPLPVELASFTAEARGAVAHLAWTTAAERNNRGFAVEASADGADFRRLGWVPGQGSTPLPSTYRFEDAALASYRATTVYYRLRQLDTDGTETLSPVRAVVVPTGLAATLRLWPNPTRGSVTAVGLAAGQPVQLLDLAGRVLLTTTFPATGSLQLELPAGLAPGVYVVRGGGQARRLVVE
ncbi:zinc-dependent metalloprotease [Hymenobacter weizhouensis]|uniref:zinc-dependent metalloprotease n=1 Tax=Hymenobacter sp. YIM 151500-1 TaxID=2987689 RepID=UPI002227DE12|nr:zinc-dependent metalloprotease family protein [Hymenobacter sp. YIM 151500-1]UYZ63421.1 M12 family metallo-peptidase [Hymenobacter sp. YIM 151500-1]